MLEKKTNDNGKVTVYSHSWVNLWNAFFCSSNRENEHTHTHTGEQMYVIDVQSIPSDKYHTLRLRMLKMASFIRVSSFTSDTQYPPIINLLQMRNVFIFNISPIWIIISICLYGLLIHDRCRVVVVVDIQTAHLYNRNSHKIRTQLFVYYSRVKTHFR